MSTITVGKSTTRQINAGAAILAAARTVDTRLIKDRLAAFDRAQQGYVQAQAKVQQADAEVEKAHAQFRTEQQGLVDTLARALVADGQPLRDPFAAFAGLQTGVLMRLAPAEAAKALPELVAAIRRSKTLGKGTLQAVQSAEKVTRGMEPALARLEALRTVVRDARATRDAVAQAWELALGALKRGARAAADDGAPNLYATLFERAARTSTKASKPTPQPSPQPSSLPAAAPTSTPEPAAS